jgi:hypothetical protein
MSTLPHIYDYNQVTDMQLYAVFHPTFNHLAVLERMHALTPILVGNIQTPALEVFSTQTTARLIVLQMLKWLLAGKLTPSNQARFLAALPAGMSGSKFFRLNL